ncbi:hypothetical protein [Roseicella aerolata]|uniref:Uncharacterized protein n=1 Tax=Roseicella aerolata TaxID=2883479 RepID=A0A9X1IC91_9PROT|nr:hypothetical protein [Roseicella aerolata]MCB4821073.1 hypothetical protein [Roseicella aerolata]
MATTTTLGPDISGQNNAAPPVSSIITDNDLARFMAGRPATERAVDLMAFALAAEKRQAPSDETIDRFRQEAATALSEYAFRYMHNAVEQIRREAMAEQLSRLGRPPGFGTLLLANLLALAIAGLVAAWLVLHPATLAGLAGLLSG